MGEVDLKFLNWITSLLVLLLFVSAVFATDGNELDTLRAQISFEEKNYDFGDTLIPSRISPKS